MIENFVELLVSIWKGILYFIPGVGRPDRVLEFTWGHLTVTLVTMFFAILIGVALGILITRVRSLYNPIITIAGIVYTIPSLALFGIMIPILGIGFESAVTALTLYSLLAIIRNTAVGLDEVDPAIIEAARGMGLRDRQILWQVELPLALPIILAGIRIAVVSTISLATIAAFFGFRTLGSLILEGFGAGGTRNDKIVAGAIAASLLAIFFSQMLKQTERALRKGA